MSLGKQLIEDFAFAFGEVVNVWVKNISDSAYYVEASCGVSVYNINLVFNVRVNMTPN